MYTRTLLLKRYSRLAALYSILETERQPSLGGRGLAMADAQASSDAAMTTATVTMLWRNVMCFSFPRYSSRYPTPFFQQTYAFTNQPYRRWPSV
jgi:hypothetical protein